ncbi:hypothetical protein AAL_03175 [Moelleriella libera RCEF 2490]|uniref:Conserved oligomeric Golgi complex subunit 2 n=1 Tax=Moelleriella libera RCEF 2490 TaxID=1081109 RepID=A0A168ECH7_9HYPO|nr:hypothetical protein AAL_03175 [Moelleriella libera RCEF 2490]
MAHSTFGSDYQQRAASSGLASYNLPSDSSDSGSDTPLPFPEALPRSDFLVAGFDPAAYLSALPHRHQTLEDLRSDLRDRSSTISTELLELVNSNYTAFLSLGSELKGGDEKVGDVKVALLGFRRAVEEVKAKVATRTGETTSLNNELHSVRSSIERGRKLLELHERLLALEGRLTVDSLPTGAAATGPGWDSDGTDDDDESEKGPLGSSPAKLLQSAIQYDSIEKLRNSMDRQHPYVIKQEERLLRCRNTLLLDLGTALKEAKSAGGPTGQDRVLKYLAIYPLLSAEADAIKTLKGG